MHKTKRCNLSAAQWDALRDLRGRVTEDRVLWHGRRYARTLRSLKKLGLVSLMEESWPGVDKPFGAWLTAAGIARLEPEREA